MVCKWSTPILNAMYLFSQGLGEYTTEAEKQDDEEYHISIQLPKRRLEFSLFWTHAAFSRALDNPKALCPQSPEIRSALDVTVKARENFDLVGLEEAPLLPVTQGGHSDRCIGKCSSISKRKEVAAVGLG